MKKLITIILLLTMILPSVALADLPDISGLSFDELVQLREQINLAIWNSEEWQEVTVPIGAWQFGKDIPVGKWTISVASDSPYDWAAVVYCDKLKGTGIPSAASDCRIWQSTTMNSKSSDDVSSPTSIDIDGTEGMYIIIDKAPVVFTPYAGKPDLGFK